MTTNRRLKDQQRGFGGTHRRQGHAASIPWYLLVEQESLSLYLYQRQGFHYVERSVTRPGEVLELTEPVKATIRPEELLP
ncbi:hypothetical protein ACWEOS_25535 [Micromonospora taraxaci]|uniref:hypothetical protein n=1 Tax=Micromonospora taraxaci TaxID=1316803 RepID=UPI0033BA5528